MTERSPRVSIGLPVWNGEDYLEAALDSILAQTFEDFELVICDNASDDRTGEICRAYAARDERVRYHRNEHNLGAGRNYNRVFELSRGEYFKWAAHDDLCAPRMLETCVGQLDGEPGVVLCYTRAQVIDRNGKDLRERAVELEIRGARPLQRFRQYVNWLRRATVIHPAIFGLARREALAQTGLIGLYISSDQVLLGELALLGEFRELVEPLFAFRWHPASSVNAHRGFAQRMRWFDPTFKGRLMFPHCRVLREYVVAVRRLPLSWADRWGAYLLIAAQCRWQGKALLHEMVVNAALALGFRRIGLPGFSKALPDFWGRI